MARKRRNARRGLSGPVAGLVALIGMYFGLSVPRTIDGKFVATVVAVALGFAVRGLLAYLFRGPRPSPFGSSEPARPSEGERKEPVWFPDAKDDALSPWEKVVRDAERAPARPRDWNLDLLRRLEWRRFEEACAGYFELLGFTAKLNQFGSDGGVDIHLFAAGSGKPSIAVQCKAWTSEYVGVEPVRALLGSMADQKIAEGIFITTSTFSADARALGRRNNITLIDGENLLHKIRSSLTDEQAGALLEKVTRGDFETPTCASCGVKMVWREVQPVGFYGCVNFPRCRSKLFKSTRA